LLTALAERFQHNREIRRDDPAGPLAYGWKPTRRLRLIDLAGIGAMTSARHTPSAATARTSVEGPILGTDVGLRYGSSRSSRAVRVRGHVRRPEPRTPAETHERSAAMFATRVSVRLAEGMQEQAREGLRDEVLPRVKAAPGFVAGYWFAPDGDRGSSVVFWDTKEAADAMAAQLQPGAHPAPPVTVEQVDVVEVIAHI